MTLRYTTYLHGSVHLPPVHVLAPEPPHLVGTPPRDNTAYSVCGLALPATREKSGRMDCLYLHLRKPKGVTPCEGCRA